MNELSSPLKSEKLDSDSDQSLQAWLQVLTAESTVGELPAFEATVHPEVPTNVVDRELGASHELPGVVIATDGELLGMISRPMLLAHLSRPFGQDLYLKRPIRLLLEAEQNQPLVLPSDLLVGDAAHAALQRPAELVYEPVVVRDGLQFRLLDVHTLLIAQSRLLALANKTIRSQADIADAANRAKSIFLANMSHEIRTPLTAILGFAENLLEIEIPVEERTSAVKTILRNGHHLLQLINDILDLSKIEAGRLEIEQLRFSPGELIADVLSALKFRADAKQIGLTLVYDGPIPDAITSDPTRLRQILMNLVSNAIKFTERGQVVVRLKMIDDQGNIASTAAATKPIQMRLDVVDSGIGISDEQRDRLFSPFMQADESTARRFGGTGLGLSISRRLANLLGGDIVVTSQPNVGSTFSLQIEVEHAADVTWHDRPSAVGKPSTAIAGPSQIRLNGRFLLAEDGPDNQILIGSFLRKFGADVTIVDNGRKAVETALASLQEGVPFQIILMDMQMPILDGYSATSELRARGWTRPILALTANVMQGDRQKCVEAGCNDFATKPINRNELIKQIHNLTSGDTSSEPQVVTNIGRQDTADTEAPHFDVKTALQHVGDDEDLLHQIATMLVQIGPRWLEELERHLNHRDQNPARRVAHSLRNSSENIGGMIAGEAFSRLESAAAKGDLDEALSIWPECCDKFRKLIQAVELFLQSTESAINIPSQLQEKMK